MDKIGFVILTWNSQDCIGACLESIAELKDIAYGIVIADNGSTDSTIDIINRNFVHLSENDNCGLLETIRYESNMGTTIGRNAGIRKFDNTYNYICILDSDTIINEDAMKAMIAVLASDNSNGIAGPQMRTKSGILQNSGRKIPTLRLKLMKALSFFGSKDMGAELERYPDINDQPVHPVGYLMSACWMIKRDVINKVGMLDEKIFYAPEDVEYCIRIWLGGYRVLYCNDAHIIHEWQRLSKKKLFSKHNFEHIKGLMYMFNKYRFWFNADKIEQLVH